MTYMIIEHFYEGKVKAIYERVAKEGRFIPDGVRYINSWINEDVTICYQVMEADTREQLQAWIDNWKGYADFEVVPVISSAEAKSRVLTN